MMKLNSRIPHAEGDMSRRHRCPLPYGRGSDHDGTARRGMHSWRRRACTIAAVLAIAAPPLSAQSSDALDAAHVKSADAEAGPSSDELTGFWPTPKMIELLVRRQARESAQEYDLRPDQLHRLETQMLDQWRPFLKENRNRIQPLVNDYFEMRMGLEPPTSDQVADWAKRAMPVYKDIRKRVETGQQKLSEMLTPRQRAKLKMERMKTAATLEAFESSLERWRSGTFQQNELWQPPPGYRSDDAKPATTSQPFEPVETAPQFADLPDRAAEELSFWIVWVDQFCERYELDRSQRNAAHSILREMLGRARDHVRANTERIEAVERIIEDATAPADEPAVLAELNAVYGPLENMGQELQTRIERLPTTAQRRRVQLRQEAGASPANAAERSDPTQQ